MAPSIGTYSVDGGRSGLRSSIGGGEGPERPRVRRADSHAGRPAAARPPSGLLAPVPAHRRAPQGRGCSRGAARQVPVDVPVSGRRHRAHVRLNASIPVPRGDGRVARAQRLRRHRRTWCAGPAGPRVRVHRPSGVTEQRLPHPLTAGIVSGSSDWRRRSGCRTRADLQGRRARWRRTRSSAKPSTHCWFGQLSTPHARPMRCRSACRCCASAGSSFGCIGSRRGRSCVEPDRRFVR